MKYFLSFLLILIFLTIMFFLRPESDDFSLSLDEVNSESISQKKIDKKTIANKREMAKNDLMPFDREKKLNDLSILGQEIIDEVSECERKFDEVLTVSINEIHSIDNQSLIYILEDFDQMKLSSPKLGFLMESLLDLPSKQLSKNQEIMDNLSLIRPCRPFEKISFINELTKRYKDNSGDEFFRKKIKKSLRKYLKKELEYPVNLSTINMLSNVVMSLIEEKVFDETMKEKSEMLLEDLENDFDDLVELAEETLDKEEDSFDTGLLRKESILSQKYKNRLLELIDKI